MLRRTRIKTFFLLLGASFFLLPLAKGQFYNGSQVEFGKNRLQHRDFLWRYYRFENFDTYFHTGGKDLAIYTAKRADHHIKDIQGMLDFALEDKIRIIIYNKHSYFKQSNIGYSRRNRHNVGGTTPIVGNKLFVYYTGDHRSLDRQIREGIARVMIRQMMYGGNWKDVLKNSTLLSIPDWYINGVVSYIARDWSTRLDSRVRDGILSGRYKKFNRLKRQAAVNAGHAMWKFIADKYGEGVIPNILYMTKMSRNIESGLLFVLGTTLDGLTQEYLDHYRKAYRKDARKRNRPQLDSLPIESEKRTVYDEFELSPNGRYAAFSSNELGQYKVFIYDRKKQEKERIFKEGHKLDRIPDHSYPVLEWHPKGGALVFVTEEKGEPKFHTYSLEDEKLSTKPLFDLEKVLDMDYSPDGTKMVFSAVQDGMTNLYRYHPVGNRSNKLTNDTHDDLQPTYLDEDRIIFSSNRADDTLREGKVAKKYLTDSRDLFLFNLDHPKGTLKRLTETEHADESHPSPYDSARFTFLSDRKGIENRYLGHFDSAITYVDTTVHYRYFAETDPLSNFSRNLIHYEMAPSNGLYTALTYIDGKYRFFYGKRKNDRILPKNSIPSTPYAKRWAKPDTGSSSGKKKKGKKEQASKGKKESGDSSEVNIKDYVFDKEKKKKKKKEGGKKRNLPDDIEDLEEVGDTSITYKGSGRGDSASFELPTQRNYEVDFTTQQVTLLQLDNGYMNKTYQNFNPGNPVYNNPGINGMVSMAIHDLFEDHHVYGGFRASGNLNNNEYFITYEDLSAHLDKSYSFHRRSFMNVGDQTATKTRTLQGEYQLIHPFSPVASLRGTFMLRNDRRVTLATEQRTLRKPNVTSDRGGFKLAYVFDNTLPLGINLRRGLRMKFFGEYYQELQNFEKGDMFVLGGDVRHYLRIHRNFIWANRLAGSTSFGSQQLIYYMGGVDSWFLPEFRKETPIDEGRNFRFQTLATPMRGFIQNARNGNSFALINSEFRFPVVDYFKAKPIRSDFLKTFQILAFGEMGTAWTGPDPYSEKNSFNVRTIEKGPIKVTIRNQREPLIGSYGLGLRGKVWGYFVRATWGWGVEDRQVKQPRFYISLSKDF
ncbi:MAG: hypothetical protein ABEH38_07475 [Flavobacteriales bacterium]